jgi:glycerol kinase
MVFDRPARIAAVAQKEHEQIYPKPGWVEHDPLEIVRRKEESGRSGELAGNAEAEAIKKERQKE